MAAAFPEDFPFDDPNIQLKESCKLYIKLAAMFIKKGIGNLIKNGTIRTAAECHENIMMVMDKVREVINDENSHVLIQNLKEAQEFEDDQQYQEFKTLDWKKASSPKGVGRIVFETPVPLNKKRNIFGKIRNINDTEAAVANTPDRGFVIPSHKLQNDKSMLSLTQLQEFFDEAKKQNSYLFRNSPDENAGSANLNATYNASLRQDRGMNATMNMSQNARKPKGTFDLEEISSTDDEEPVRNAIPKTSGSNQRRKKPKTSLELEDERRKNSIKRKRAEKRAKDIPYDFDDLLTDDDTDEMNDGSLYAEWARDKIILKKKIREQEKQNNVNNIFGAVPQVELFDMFPKLEGRLNEKNLMEMQQELDEIRQQEFKEPQNSFDLNDLNIKEDAEARKNQYKSRMQEMQEEFRYLMGKPMTQAEYDDMFPKLDA